MTWFYVVVVLMNNSGMQAFSPDSMGFVPAQTTKTQIQMPDQATCEATRALNGVGECWAKMTDKK